MNKEKVFLLYDDDNEEIVGIYDTKLNAMEGMFKHWCDEEDIDKKHLKIVLAMIIVMKNHMTTTHYIKSE